MGRITFYKVYQIKDKRSKEVIGDFPLIEMFLMEATSGSA
jgi:hypothetical protein